MNKNTDFPLRKTFVQDFVSHDGKKLFTLSYEQATLTQYFEFQEKTDDEKYREVLDLVVATIPLSVFESILSFFYRIIGKKYYPKILGRIDITKIIKNITLNRFRTHTSVFEREKSNKQSLYSANLSVICDKYNLTPLELYNNYTLQQYVWLIDGIIYLGNEQTKEGQTRNRNALIDKEAIAKRAEETRKAFNNNK